jgi:hypothetical protein
MKSALCCLVLGILPALGQIAPVAVYTKFQQPPPAGVLVTLKAETAAILSRLDVQVEWRSIDKVTGNEVWAEVAVVTFKGSCGNSDASTSYSPSRRLGWTHISDGEVLPFAEVDCDLVRSFLASQLVSLDRADADRRFARALGRVVAHELYHILSRSPHHSNRGVDQPAYTAQELVSDRFLIEESPYRVLQSGAGASRSGGASANGSSLFRERGCTACHGTRAEGTKNGPALRVAGRFVSPVALAARLGMGAGAMLRKAGRLKVPPPSVAEGELGVLVRFLNTGN